MDKQLIHYYSQKVGTGLVGFQGIKYQRVHGFFGRLLSKAVFAVLRFLGKHALSTGANIASDVILDKKNWKDAAKERLEETGIDIAKTGIDRAKKYVHEGKGRKRRYVIGSGRKRRPKKAIKRRKGLSNIEKLFE